MIKAFSVALIFCSLSAFAIDTYTWQGGSEGEWAKAANWVAGGVTAESVPGEGDAVDFTGTTAKIIISDTTTITSLKLDLSAKITIASDSSTVRTFNVIYDQNGSYAGVTDSTLTLDAVILYHCISKTRGQWGANGTFPFKGKSTLQLLNGAKFYVGYVSCDDTMTAYVGTNAYLWIRNYNKGSIQNLDFTIDDGTLDGYYANTRLAATGNINLTFKGTKCKYNNYLGAPLVGGTLTLRYVLPESPTYVDSKSKTQTYSPMVSAINGQTGVLFESGNAVSIEIDPESPAFKSGTVQTYRLMSYDSGTTSGIKQDNITTSGARTQTESFAFSQKADYGQTYDQYLDFTADGSYDPGNADMEATFSIPASFKPDMRFGGNLAIFGTSSGTTATSATLTLDYGTTEALGTSVSLGTVTELGDFAFDYSGFDSTSTYYYKLTLENNLGQTVVSDVGTCSHICGTQLGEEISATMENGRGTVSGSVYVLGAGTTTVTLWFGTDGVNFTAHESFTVDATGPFDCEVIYPCDGKLYYKFTCENSYESQQWEDATAASFISVSDANTYTWTGGDGDSLDKAHWICGVADSGIGYPTTASSVVFPANTSARVQFTNAMHYAKMTFLQDDSDYTFYGNGARVDLDDAATGGKRAKLLVDNVYLNDYNYIWQGKFNLSCGVDTTCRCVNGAKLCYRYLYLDSTNSTVVLESGSSIESAGGSMTGYNAKLVVSNAQYYAGNPFKGNTNAAIVLKGDTPKALFKNGSPSGHRFEIYLPATPYAAAPIQNREAAGNFPSSRTPLNIVNARAVRGKTVGTWRLVDWSCYNDGSPTRYGLITNNFAFGGIRSRDTVTYSWKDGWDDGTLGPQYLDLNLAEARGVVVLFR